MIRPQVKEALGSDDIESQLDVLLERLGMVDRELNRKAPNNGVPAGPAAEELGEEVELTLMVVRSAVVSAP